MSSSIQKYKLNLSKFLIAGALIIIIQQLFIGLNSTHAGQKLLISQLITECIGILLLFQILLFHKEFAKRLMTFFCERDHAINLAIFRIVLFGMLQNGYYNQSAWYADFPDVLQFPPRGWEHVLPWLPINSQIVEVAAGVMRITCFMALIGIFTRFSTIMSTILYFYLAGITQFYGKINHGHHILWFMTIIAFSRCADSLSVDALWRAWKNARTQKLRPSIPSTLYALPLRFIWILMGIIYFFPGFYKAYTGGMEWIFSENLKFHMYYKWFELDAWMPFFRIDQYPFLYQSGALFVIAMEMSFVVLVFLPKGRYVAFLGGLIFHNMTNFMMRISFMTLQKCYVAFINWHYVLSWIGKKIFKEELLLVYDGKCLTCRRTIAMIHEMDVLNSISFIDAHDSGEKDPLKQLGRGKEEYLKSMHVIVNNHVWTGFLAYRKIAARLIFSWPVTPLLYLRPIQKFGESIYNTIAFHRTCSSQSEIKSKSQIMSDGSPKTRVLVVVATVLIVANIYCGVYQIHTWPFTCYPTFAWLRRGPIKQSVKMELIDEKGNLIPYKSYSFAKKFGTDKLAMTLLKILYTRNQEIREARLKALFNIWKETDTEVKKAEQVLFYREFYVTIPELSERNPLKRELIFELQNDAKVNSW